MAKDRAAPFSRKHRKYWLPVTGGMLLIGLINIVIGMCSYTEPSEPERIQLVLPGQAPVHANGTLGASELPAAVMRAFAVKYPRTIPSGADVVHGATGTSYVVWFPAGAAHRRATFGDDGAFIAED